MAMLRFCVGIACVVALWMTEGKVHFSGQLTVFVCGKCKLGINVSVGLWMSLCLAVFHWWWAFALLVASRWFLHDTMSKLLSRMDHPSGPTSTLLMSTLRTPSGEWNDDDGDDWSFQSTQSEMGGLLRVLIEHQIIWELKSRRWYWAHNREAVDRGEAGNANRYITSVTRLWRCNCFQSLAAHLEGRTGDPKMQPAWEVRD